MAGIVYLVGAGPGDPGLLTVRGAACLGRADVVIADHLASPRLLALAPPSAERYVRGPRRTGLSQAAIIDLCIERARAGKTVVRLKGGDPFVFGRGGEEADALRAAGVDFEVVPGVTAGVAVPAYAGIPLTHRGAAAAVAFVTGHEADDKDAGHVHWEALAAGATTLVLYMSVEKLGAAMRRLCDAGCPEATPAAVISDGTRATQRTVVATVATIAGAAREAGLRAPALTVVGEVVRLRDRLAWFERRPLHGARILVTRAAHQAESTAEQLEDLGAEVVLAPAIEIAPPEDLADIDNAVQSIQRYSLIAFASANAVDSFFARLDAAGLDARRLAGAALAAVGPRTAEALAARGLRADIVATDNTAEGLAAALAHLPPGHALLPRAAEGRDALEKALAARGFTVDAPAAYRTLAVAPERLAFARDLLAASSIDAVTFGSPSAARALLAALGDAAAALLAPTLVAAVGPTTSAALTSTGVRVDLVPDPHTFAALTDALVPALRLRLLAHIAARDAAPPA